MTGDDRFLSNDDMRIREAMNQAAREQQINQMFQLTLENLYDMAAGMINEAAPPLRGAERQAVTVALRVLSRFFEIQAVKHGATREEIERTMRWADKMAESMRPAERGEGQLSVINTPYSGLVDMHGRPLR